MGRHRLLGVDAVWFMGVWERSPAGIDIANKNEGLLADFGGHCPITGQKTTWGLRIVFDNMWLTNTWAVPKAWPLLGRELAQAWE